MALNIHAANTYTVNATTDSGSGSGTSGDLRYCITQANSNPGSTINFSVAANSTITLGSNMVPIQTNMTINGSGSSGLKIDGNSNQYCPFFVYSSNSSTVTISSMTIQNAASVGGTGGIGISGGGGALGAGGAIFVNNLATVVLTDINFSSNKATGGAGGVSTDSFFGGGGGGGMLGGVGGIGGAYGGGGGAGLSVTGGTGGANGTTGILIGTAPAGNGAGTSPGLGGTQGGGGGGGSDTSTYGGGGGGGVGGNNASGLVGGTGANFGGGGGGAYGGNGTGGVGGFGSGGGGGGGSGSTNNGLGGKGGFGGGTGGGLGNTIYTSGNGGSGFGGAIFVRSGGTLTINNSANSTSFNGNTVTAGMGYIAGTALGQDLFLQSTGASAMTFNVGNGFTQTLNGTISDDNGIGGGTGGSLVASGAGTLILANTSNSYIGGTVINAGIVQVSADGCLGNTTGGITFGGGTLKTTSGFSSTRTVTVNGSGGTIDTNGNALTLSGAITGMGGLTVASTTNTLTLSGANNFGPLVLNGGTTTLSTNNQTITSLSGSGALTLTGTILTISETSNAIFSGNITGTGGITKSGTATQTLSGNTLSYTGATTVSAGTLLIGNTLSTSMITLSSGATLGLIGGNSYTIAAKINGTGGTLLMQGSGTVTLGSGSNSFAGSVAITSGTLLIDASIASASGVSVSNGAFFGFSGTTSFTYLGPTISGAGGLSMQDTGTVVLSSAHIYTGPTNITAGILQMGTANALSNATAVTLSAGGTLALNSNALTIANLSGAGNVTLGSATLTVSTTTATTFSGVISGTGGLTQSGAGALTLTLSGANTFGGTTTITNGEIKLPAGGSLAGAVSIGSGATLEMNGGSVADAITGSGTSALLVSGNYTPSSTITNVGTINVTGGTFTVSKAVTGTTTVNIAAPGAVTLNSGGSLSGTISGTGTLNLNTAFTAPNPFSIGTLNVNAAGTLTLNNNMSANVNNAGTIVNTGIGSITLTGNYVQSGGALNVTVEDINNFGQLIVTGTGTINGGSVNVSLPGNTANILDKDTFNIITANGGMTVNSASTVTYPTTTLLSFVSKLSGNSLQLVAVRTPLEDIDSNPEWRSLARLLDKLRERGVAETKLSGVLNVLDVQTTMAGVDDILSNLAPEGVANESILQPITQNLPYAFIEHRLETFRSETVARLQGGFSKLTTGYMAGDVLEGNGSYGPMFFGNSIKQQTRNGIAGYTAFTGGFGILADAPLNEYYRFGGGVSYSQSAVKQSDMTGSVLNFGTLQGTLYGSASYGPLFLDVLASIGANNYHNKRNIIVTGQTATANYQGVQYGGKLKGGFIIPVSTVEISPLATLLYSNLNQGQYTEQGAPGVNLSVNTIQVHQVQIGLGGSIAEVSQPEEFLPELHMLYLYDTKPANLIVTSQFVDIGGGSFTVAGVQPPRAGTNFGGSITSMMTDQVMLIGSYDVILKKGFVSQSATLKFKFIF